MIIGIDVSSIPYGTGVSNYTLNLVTNLLSQDHNNTYKLFYSSLRLPLPSDLNILMSKYPNVHIYHYRLPPTLLHWLWNKIHIIPIEFFIGKCDVFHTSDWTQPPTVSAKTITTVHDLAPFLYPQWQHPRIITTHAAKMKWAIKECSSIICVSQNTLTDFRQLFPNYSGLINVVYEAAEDKYSRFRTLTPSQQEEKINSIKKIYSLDKFILAQGTREPRKNLNRTIKAFKLFKLKHPGSKLELAIAGKYGWGQDVDHNKYPYIKILGFIPEKDMVPLHAAAVAVIYPSLYEGFGLPLVKAMALGVPLITSNISSTAEIAQDAAILVNPKSTHSILKGVESIYLNSNLRQNLVSKELARSKCFSWKKTALETIKTYEKLS